MFVIRLQCAWHPQTLFFCNLSSYYTALSLSLSLSMIRQVYRISVNKLIVKAFDSLTIVAQHSYSDCMDRNSHPLVGGR